MRQSTERLISLRTRVDSISTSCMLYTATAFYPWWLCALYFVQDMCYARCSTRLFPYVRCIDRSFRYSDSKTTPSYLAQCMLLDLCFIHQDITHRSFATVASRNTLSKAKRLSGFSENSFLHKPKSRAEFPLSTQSPAKNCQQDVQWLAGKRDVR
ncbi:hypothetical protein AUEXF2481DRAFT_116787 [Aureobasidium subglaciale EXF-2481]|uniref:Uncharacterized protein n=1 Tax=Aureobasidium subglaciale (strain EXF-2481) TaxID=1043005 RepID=A0A074Z165_AURSE|nr:uncharacterized protein AUEXF2481DRAFT_116787 [Aureobasidium subglaciale EXF-2481]KER00093.1 hypothetical protein AUEXF2481DRAFT_116787 [Aureobasidium subglaciale EXF-2481]